MYKTLTILFSLTITVCLFLSFPSSAHAGFFNVSQLLDDIVPKEEDYDAIFNGPPFEGCPVGGLCLQVNFYPFDADHDLILCKDPVDPPNSSVPEANTAVLLGVGLFASFLLPRKRNHAK